LERDATTEASFRQSGFAELRYARHGEGTADPFSSVFADDDRRGARMTPSLLHRRQPADRVAPPAAMPLRSSNRVDMIIPGEDG
jgi:hypothetical protein